MGRPEAETIIYEDFLGEKDQGKASEVILVDRNREPLKGQQVVPKDIPLAAIKGFWCSTDWGGTRVYSPFRYNGVSRGAVKPTHLLTKPHLTALKKEGITTVADLEHKSVKGLSEISGIGEITAYRLIRIAQHSGVAARGTGFPWEVEISVEIPTDHANILLKSEAGKKEVKDAISEFIEQNSNDIFPRLGELITTRKIKELQKKREQIEEEMKKIQEAKLGRSHH